VIFILILIAYPFIKRVPYLRGLVMITGKEQPALATAEYRAEISEGDIGAPLRELTSEEMIAEASAAKYGKIRQTAPDKKPQPKGQKPQGGNTKNGKK
jgi:hypothetical protein